MSEVNPLDFVYDSYDEARMDRLWGALVDRSETDDSVQASGIYRDSPLWQQFGWGHFPSTHLRQFADDTGPERWTVPDRPHVEIKYDLSPFTDAIAADQRGEPLAEDLLDLVTFVYAETDRQARFAYGPSDLHTELLAGNEVPLPVTAESLADDRIEYATWLMLFPPAMVDTYGRETLLSAPAWRVRELEDGSVLVVSTPNPASPGGTAEIDDHLGIDRPAELDDHRY